MYAIALWQYVHVYYLSFGGYPLYASLEEYIVHEGDIWLWSRVCRWEERWDVGSSWDYASCY